MENISQGSRFQSIAASGTTNFPHFNQAITLFGAGINLSEIYVRSTENYVEYLKLRDDKFDIFAIKNRLIGLLHSQPDLVNKVQIGEAKFDRSTVYTMISFCTEKL